MSTIQGFAICLFLIVVGIFFGIAINMHILIEPKSEAEEMKNFQPDLEYALISGVEKDFIEHEKRIATLEQGNYDPNNPIYKFIPPAHESWINEFGDDERTRLIHGISETRVLLAALAKSVLEIEKKLKDPNEAAE